jgi:hypothetical protein
MSDPTGSSRRADDTGDTGVPPSGPDRPLTADEADRIDAADARDQDATEIEPSVAPGEGATTALAGDGSDTPVMRVVTDDDAARVGVHESDADDETADPDDAVGEGADETATLPDASPAFTASSTSGASAVGMAGRVRGRLPRARDVTTATTGGTATAATDQLPYVDDRVSRFWVLAIAATFAAILLYGLMLGRGGFLTPIAAPTPTLAPTPSPVVSPSPSPSASPSASASPSGSPSASPSGSPSVSPSGSGAASPSASPSASPAASSPAATTAPASVSPSPS